MTRSAGSVTEGYGRTIKALSGLRQKIDEAESHITRTMRVAR